MKNPPSKHLVLFTGAILIAACAKTAPTESPAAGPTAIVLATSDLTVQPANAATAISLPATKAPTATEPATSQPTETEPPPTETPTPVPTPTQSPTPAVPTATPEVEEVVAALAGLSLDDFFEESYRQLLLRSPRKLTELGLGDTFGLRNDQLDDLSEGTLRDTQRLNIALLDMLHTYDRAALTHQQQVSYDVYEWYLDNRVRGHEFSSHDYPLVQIFGGYKGYVFQLNELLTELHPLENRQDIEDYIARLSQVDDQVAQLLEGLAKREEMGVIPPDFILRMARQDLLGHVGSSSGDPATIRAASLEVYTVFSDAVREMGGLSSEEKTAYRESALEEIRIGYIPAFVELLNAIGHMTTIATEEAGVWKLPNGDAYYAHVLRQETSTDLTPDQVHEMGLAESTRIHAEMREIFDELSYPQDLPVGELIQRAIEDGSMVSGSQVVPVFEEILADIDQRVETVFDLRPSAPVVVVPEPIFGGYYTPGAADGSRPAAFHATVGSGASRAEMPSIAYHEAIPGHHFQMALAQEMALPTFRRYEYFNAHLEGWALYAELLASELGVYENDPYGNVGRLRLELVRAARLVVDTGIHAKRWTREESHAYLDDNVGGWSHEVERYVVWPAQATGYKIGMLKILELRQRAMDQLGDRFDIKEFHNVMLGNGILPLTILERLVDEYIEATQ